jgi:hypothetical protein
LPRKRPPEASFEPYPPEKRTWREPWLADTERSLFLQQWFRPPPPDPDLERIQKGIETFSKGLGDFVVGLGTVRESFLEFQNAWDPEKWRVIVMDPVSYRDFVLTGTDEIENEPEPPIMLQIELRGVYDQFLLQSGPLRFQIDEQGRLVLGESWNFRPIWGADFQRLRIRDARNELVAELLVEPPRRLVQGMLFELTGLTIEVESENDPLVPPLVYLDREFWDWLLNMKEYRYATR